MVPKDIKITVLGDGGWGTTLALLLADRGYDVSLWGAFPGYTRQMQKKRENFKFLPGFRIPESIRLAPQIKEACKGSHYIVLAVPCKYMRKTLDALKQCDSLYRKKSMISVAKGVDKESLQVMSQLILSELGTKISLGVLSGPNIAREVALKMPTAACVASKEPLLLNQMSSIFSTDYFSVYKSSDMVGIELGGALKNVIAISSGIVEGLGYGSNTQAALFSRGLAEMARLGIAMGAQKETFMGLSGVGDLATTCLSRHSRNRWLGEQIGKGGSLKKILSESEMVFEGVDTAQAAYRLAHKHKTSMPITEAVHEILFEKGDPRKAIKALMKNHGRGEFD